MLNKFKVFLDSSEKGHILIDLTNSTSTEDVEKIVSNKLRLNGFDYNTLSLRKNFILIPENPVLNPTIFDEVFEYFMSYPVGSVIVITDSSINEYFPRTNTIERNVISRILNILETVISFEVSSKHTNRIKNIPLIKKTTPTNSTTTEEKDKKKEIEVLDIISQKDFDNISIKLENIIRSKNGLGIKKKEILFSNPSEDLFKENLQIIFEEADKIGKVEEIKTLLKEKSISKDELGTPLDINSITSFTNYIFNKYYKEIQEEAGKKLRNLEEKLSDYYSVTKYNNEYNSLSTIIIQLSLVEKRPLTDEDLTSIEEIFKEFDLENKNSYYYGSFFNYIYYIKR